ncbi:N-acetyltransferase [Kaistella haifensis]|uniref:N-acetyltransferase n=1 Tax=Kaistella haifensis DSM 19056 TaxID=1450526 RepID=A0A246B741_9FLAO|nr:N-acetyltransferase [Kaistella haifensis]OWK97193.1 N-acetyltransferase [Kaistella haifensis DSM 19056]ROI10226.1 N-acetyltransferase [Kaistella haifensis]
MELNNKFIVTVAENKHLEFVPVILKEIEESAKERGTGIAKRSAAYLEEKINEGKAVMAFSAEGEWAGFCYIETWSNKEYVANSGLIVAKKFRKDGLAKAIKQKIFSYSREKYPNAKLFGLTTGLAVMKINSSLGYKPVTYSELTQDEVFWSGCKSCVNFEILNSKDRKNCLCTAMLYNPEENKSQENSNNIKSENDQKLFSKFKKIKTMLWKK